jgi:hypothetical protein
MVLKTHPQSTKFFQKDEMGKMHRLGFSFKDETQGAQSMTVTSGIIVQSTTGNHIASKHLDRTN